MALLDLLANQAMAKLPSTPADQLCSMLWGFASLGYIPATPLLEAAAGAILRNLALFNPKHAAEVGRGCGRMC